MLLNGQHWTDSTAGTRAYACASRTAPVCAGNRSVRSRPEDSHFKPISSNTHRVLFELIGVHGHWHKGGRPFRQIRIIWGKKMDVTLIEPMHSLLTNSPTCAGSEHANQIGRCTLYCPVCVRGNHKNFIALVLA